MVQLACSNEFQLTEGAVDIPIVYGDISVTDTATYIRLERAFVNETTSAYELSKDPNMLYYQDAIVKIKHIKSGKDFLLKRVDGNLEGYKRDAGAFAEAPNYLYKINKKDLKLIPQDEYKLIISKSDGAVLTEASAVVLSELIEGDVEPKISSKLSFAYNIDFKVTWYPDLNAVIHDLTIHFHFDEEKNGKTELKTVSWTAAKNFTDKALTGNGYPFTTKGRGFYEFMQGAMEKNPAIKRYFKSATMEITSGSKEVKEYISYGQVNLGITSSGEIPVYTNFSNNGRGLFYSTVKFKRTNIELASQTLDSLRNGIFTKELNFQ